MSGRTEGLIERAFEIADEAMVELLIGHGVPSGSLDQDPLRVLAVKSDSAPATSLEEAEPAIKEAFQWLSDRGFASLSRTGPNLWIEVRQQ